MKGFSQIFNLLMSTHISKLGTQGMPFSIFSCNPLTADNSWDSVKENLKSTHMYPKETTTY